VENEMFKKFIVDVNVFVHEPDSSVNKVLKKCNASQICHLVT